MTRIIIDVLPHQEQRYDTLGDWYSVKTSTGEHLRIVVSSLHNPLAELALIVHELVEAVVCREDGISAEMVDQFDFGFIEGQKNGVIPKDAEPGDHPDAPYKEQHELATRIEKEVLHSVGMTWAEYMQICAKVG